MGYKPLQHVLDDLKGAPLPPSGYHEFVFQWDRDFFVERADMIGFKGGRVLDAGCGFGNFSYALAQANHHVVAIDQSRQQCEIAKVLLERWHAPNVTVEIQSLPRLPYEDGSFDFIWCAGVLQFVDRTVTLETFHRLLKPGGRIYIMTNSWGRWLYKAALAHANGDVKLRDRCLAVLLAQKGTAGNLHGNYIDLPDAGAVCSAAGFKLIAADAEGMLDLSGRGRRLPMFSEHHLVSQDGEDAVRLSGNIEFVAERL